ncbi:MAG: hypothetical protein GQ548_00440 [Methylophaga sp.]|nr:hypothetical protein [Methylophaga sp.]
MANLSAKSRQFSVSDEITVEEALENFLELTQEMEDKLEQAVLQKVFST